jgi:acyl-CoA reductase-like NAD-dependent aldehyde dehydrogenase
MNATRVLEIPPIAPQTAGARAFLAARRKRLLIGGRWVDAQSGRTLESINPATGEVLAEIAAGEAADVDLAVAAARAAFLDPGWRGMTGAVRQAHLRLHGEGAGGRRRGDRAMELADRAHGHEARSGVRGRLHGGPQTR